MSRTNTLLLTVCVLAAICWVGCSSDRPNKSDNTPEDYVVYGWHDDGRATHTIGYHTLTGKIDSLPFPGTPVFEVRTAPDGKSIYIALTDRVAIQDVVTKAVTTTLPYDTVRWIIFSPDGSAVAFLYAGGLAILRVRDYTVLYHDSTITFSGAFARDGRYFYCQLGDSLVSVDVHAASIHWRRNPLVALGQDMVVSSDNSRLISYGWGYLQVYDLIRDSLLFQRRLGLPMSFMAAPPTVDRVYLTAPGDIDTPPPPYTFMMFDAVNDRMLDPVTVPSLASSGCPARDRVVGQFVTVTPDNILYVSATKAGFGDTAPPGLVVYNPSRPDTVKFVCTGTYMNFLSCQTQP